MKKVIALLVIFSLFSCSKDDDAKMPPEPVETSIVLRIEDENGLTFNDIQGDLFENGLEIPIHTEASWEEVIVDIQSYEEFEYNISIADQMGFIDDSGNSEIVIDIPSLFENDQTEVIYFSIYSSVNQNYMNNFVSASIKEGETKNVTLVVAVDFTAFEK